MNSYTMLDSITRESNLNSLNIQVGMKLKAIEKVSNFGNFKAAEIQ